MPEPAVTRHGDGGGFLVPAAVSSQSCCSGDQTTHPLPPTCPALPQNQPTAPGRTPGGPLPASYAPGQIRPGCTPALGHRVQDCAHSHGLSSNLAVATRSVPSSLSPGPQGSKPNSEGTWEEGCNPREAGIPGGQSRIRGTSPGVRTEEDQMRLGLCPQVPSPPGAQTLSPLLGQTRPPAQAPCPLSYLPWLLPSQHMPAHIAPA